MFGSVIDTARVTVARPSPKAKPVAKPSVKRGTTEPVGKAVTLIHNMNVRMIQILGVVKSVNLADPQKANVMRVMRLRQKTMRLFAKIVGGIGFIPLLCTTARRILHVAGLNGVRPDMAAVGIPILRLQSREMSRGHIVVKKVRRPMLLTVQGSTPFNAARQIAFSCMLQ